MLAWGFDPIFFGSERMTVEHLDRVSATRPVVILHASQHLMNVNTAALAAAGIDRDTDVEGIAKFDSGTKAGEPNGELQEFAAMFPITRLTGNIFRVTGASETGLRMFGQIAQLAGVTTATDLVNDLSDENVGVLQRLCAEDDFPVRIVPAYISMDGSMNRETGVARVRERIKQQHRQTAFRRGQDRRRRLDPGLHRTACAGPATSTGAKTASGSCRRPSCARRSGTFTPRACNCTSTRTATRRPNSRSMRSKPRSNSTRARIIATRCSIARWPTPRSSAAWRALGVGVNLFANHLYYWGDAHATLTMGPDRAERMDACATALAHGVPLAIHSDAPITPLGPLFTAWCAVNRLTSSGRVLGEAERISVDDALHAITLGAACSLHLDDRIGSIEVGKFADFCVLDDDPTASGAREAEGHRHCGHRGRRPGHRAARQRRLEDAPGVCR